MREAPDAQVVLEIAVVRAVRPDLDSGMEALSERVSVLERSRAGAPPSPAPVAPRRRGTGAPAAGDRDPPAPSHRRYRASAPADVGRRPSIGAVRRSQQAAARRTAAPCRPASEPHRRGGRPRRSTAADAPCPPARRPRPATAAPAPGRAVDRDSLTEAWGDGILRALPARAKALYSRRPLRRRRRRRRALRAAQRGPPRSVRRAAAPGRGGARPRTSARRSRCVLDVDDAAPAAARPQVRRPAASGRARAPARRRRRRRRRARGRGPGEFLDDGPVGRPGASAAEARLLRGLPRCQRGGGLGVHRSPPLPHRRARPAARASGRSPPSASPSTS